MYYYLNVHFQGQRVNNYLRTSRSRVLLDKLIGSQLVSLSVPDWNPFAIYWV